MRFAFFSDVHSNHAALRNVLEDVSTQGINETYCLGDLVGYGPHPNEVIDTIRRLEIPTIMGNYDDGVGFERGDCGCAYVTDQEKIDGQKSVNWTTKRVTQGNKEFLQGLYENIKFTVDGCRFMLVHGSPRRMNEYLHKDRSDDSIVRAIAGHEIDVLLCGHTHKQYHRLVSGVHVVNDGSVGKPKDGDPRACYAIVETGEKLSVEFRRIEYPVESVADEVINVGLPAAFADALITGGK